MSNVAHPANDSKQAISDAIDQAKLLFLRGDTVAGNQLLTRLYELEGVSIAYIDNALRSAGYGHVVPKRPRTILVRDLVAFTGYPPDLLTCEVDSFGVIRVADSLSHTMTTCHVISEEDQARIRAAVADGKQVI